MHLIQITINKSVYISFLIIFFRTEEGRIEFWKSFMEIKQKFNFKNFLTRSDERNPAISDIPPPTDFNLISPQWKSRQTFGFPSKGPISYISNTGAGNVICNIMCLHWFYHACSPTFFNWHDFLPVFRL